MADERLPAGMKVSVVLLACLILMGMFVTGFCVAQRGRADPAAGRYPSALQPSTKTRFTSDGRSIVR